MKNKKILVGLAAISLLGLTGCNSKYETAVSNLETTMQSLVTENNIIDNEKTIKSYNFLELDIDKMPSNYKVDINGLLTYKEDTSSTFVDLSYTVPSSFFEDFKFYGDHKTLNKINEMVMSYEPTNISYTHINNYKALNNAMGKISEDLVDKSFNKNFLYNISNITFDNNKITFDASSATKFYTTNTIMQPIYNGKTTMLVPRTEYHYYFYDQQTNISIDATAQQIAMAQNDTAYIFDLFVDAVKNNKGKITLNHYEVSDWETCDISTMEDFYLEQ